MRVLALLLTGVAGVGTLAVGEPQVVQRTTVPPPQRVDGQCRRAAALPALPREEERPTVQARPGTSYEMAAPVAAIAAPPGIVAPPPPPPPPPAVASDTADIAVTGSRVRGSARRESVAPPPTVVAPAPPPGGPTRGSAFARRVPDQQQPVPAGLLTAGEHDDLLNPELYARYVDAFLKEEPLAGVPRVDTARVLTVAVRDTSGRAVPFAAVTLTCADGNTLTLPTLADGQATFLPELDRLGSGVTIGVPGAGSRRASLTGGNGGVTQTLTLTGAAPAVRQLDLALVVDTTGSMNDELTYLQSELQAIVARTRAAHPGLDLRVALIFYRDRGDEYVTRSFPFAADLARVQAGLAAQRSDGGGDTPEAVEVAMARAAALTWRDGAVKSLFLVADAPPHADDVAATWAATEALRARRVQIVPVAASGVERGAEYVMRAMAAATQGRYLFLTDDSGIGNPHAPPAIDCYRVTRLADAMARVIDSQLSGRRVEALPGEVIRTVGTYDAGRCVLPSGWDRRQ